MPCRPSWLSFPPRPVPDPPSTRSREPVGSGKERGTTALRPGPPPHRQSCQQPCPCPLTNPSSPAPFRVLPAARAAVLPHSSDMSPWHCDEGGGGETESGKKQTRSSEPAQAALASASSLVERANEGISGRVAPAAVRAPGSGRRGPAGGRAGFLSGVVSLTRRGRWRRSPSAWPGGHPAPRARPVRCAALLAAAPQLSPEYVGSPPPCSG